jgi:hypothetical protein
VVVFGVLLFQQSSVFISTNLPQYCSQEQFLQSTGLREWTRWLLGEFVGMAVAGGDAVLDVLSTKVRGDHLLNDFL